MGSTPWLDEFRALLRADSSYRRTRGCLLLCANARWDAAGKIDGFVDELLACAGDPRPTAARQCIQAMPELIAAKPHLAARVCAKLRALDPGVYPDSTAPLVRRDIRAALQKIEG